MIATDIVRGLLNLNARLNSIINDANLNVHLEDVSKCDFDYNCENILTTQFQQQVHYLQLSNEDTCKGINLLLTKCNFEQFHNLKCLTVIEPNDSLDAIITLLPTFKQLKFLKLKETVHRSRDTLHLFSIVLSDKMPSLKNCMLLFNELIDLSQSSLSNIEYLTLENCHFHDLLQLFNYTPKIKALTVGLTCLEHENRDCTNLFSKVPNLININFCRTIGIYFEYIEELLKNLPQLKELSCTAYKLDFSNAECWYNVLKTLPLLEKFHLNLMLTNITRVVKEDIISKFDYYFIDKWPMIYEHHTINENILHIYTIPYPSSGFPASSYSYISNIKNRTNKTYQNVEHVNLVIKNTSQLTLSSHYPNVYSLRIDSEEEWGE
ncbi:unnamed protein product, partial [Didymodactylos carnosus]